MNWKQRLSLAIALAVVALVVLPLGAAWAQCPGTQVYVGGLVTDATADRGSKSNPADDMNEAFAICQECSNGAYIYRWSEDREIYVYSGVCVPEESEPTGVPLAQSVVMILLGGLALGLLVWGIYLRTRLKRLEPRA